ncbi:hypothetical protein [Pseudomonas aeruginosa]|uniref:hypothetical protein n=1 Tax=Pseudomonas aeruginosa TaxID=287 RepID=UPI001C6385DF
MKLGFFTMPIHPLDKDWRQSLREDREAFLLADELGFTEAYVAEHATDKAADGLGVVHAGCVQHVGADRLEGLQPLDGVVEIAGTTARACGVGGTLADSDPHRLRQPEAASACTQHWLTSLSPALLAITGRERIR